MIEWMDSQESWKAYLGQGSEVIYKNQWGGLYIGGKVGLFAVSQLFLRNRLIELKVGVLHLYANM